MVELEEGDNPHDKDIHDASCNGMSPCDMVTSCENCDDGCMAEIYCEGCDETLCKGCWAEHNDNAECHICGEYPQRDAAGDLTERGCAC